MNMRTASNAGIRILGTVLLRISCTSSTGQFATTKQMTYVTDSLDKWFLSREACVALGIIPESFLLLQIAQLISMTVVTPHLVALSANLPLRL